MNVFTAVKTLLAVRDYRRTAIPDDVAERILEAARVTGSAKNRQHWDFVVIRDQKTLIRLGKLASSGPYVAKAAMAIAVLIPDTFFAYIDGTRATQNMMLVAWELGVASNWIAHVDTEEIRELLSVPQDRVVMNLIAFGYPLREMGRGHKDRKPLEAIAHRERYGEPYGD